MNLLVLGPTSSSELGTSIGLGCQRCELLPLCGGTTEFDCYPRCCHCEPEACTLACPRAENWVEPVRDGGGMEMKRRYTIRQTADDVPNYIPHIQHGSSRQAFLSSGYVALTTFDVTSPDSKRVFGGPSDLRQHFRIAEHARILLLSIGKDNRLEHHWRYSASRHLPEYLASLGISHITAPNFSFALNDPRPEHLVNRNRSLREAERFTAAGLSVVPHVNAFNDKDWDCWRHFFRDHPHLMMISQEFQTGLATRNKARWHIWQLMNIEQSLGRGFRLIAVGGRRHLPLLTGLRAVTITDVNPFLKTQMRQKLVNGIWLKHTTAEGEPLDSLLEFNVTAYSDYVERRLAALRKVGPLLPKIEPAKMEVPNLLSPMSDLQLRLWPAASV